MADHLKHKKNCCSRQNAQYSAFGPNFSFSQLSGQQIQFSKIQLCHFLTYMAKYPHAKNSERLLSRS